ncbi:MGH1-like glycoside hydrolase domain-containing protein [Melittangium boletus]|uniref:MGH1-like glycoside hydrolase domain-containing protein n=1 Tax=Melittangium boletus TaxID=83453 RepID=UPI003DA39642
MSQASTRALGAEAARLVEDEHRGANWKRWGPYLAERQWGTVREDYSARGDNWTAFPHDHARSRAYRWGEDGLLGITDRQGRLCFALALWNEQDAILKERLFGLTGPQGNHGEDVKEEYFYLDSTPTHSYMKALYKYPQAAFPYERLERENQHRGRLAPEFELADTGVFHERRYFDVFAEYAKAAPDDLLIRVTVVNHGPEAARLHVLPTLWFRNTWAWGRQGEGYWSLPRITAHGEDALLATHDSLGAYRLHARAPTGAPPLARLFTDNETNFQRLHGVPNRSPHVKDAFHEAVVHGRPEALNPAQEGTKAAFHAVLEVPAGGSATLELRLVLEAPAAATAPAAPFGEAFDTVFAQRLAEADAFYAARLPAALSDEERRVARQACAGLLWTKQFYHYAVKPWQEGDPAHPAPPPERLQGRNRDWGHLYNRDIISVPDKWEYPWYAAWDTAFHMVPFARLDPHFAKEQLLLFLREWFMHPNGQIPAYEFEFSDVNPPVHAWACWRVYKLTGAHGQRDRLFLKRAFHKLLLNFTWWVNRKDVDGLNLFSGGFLGLDNIGVFDRSKPLPTGGHLNQADGTAWMAFFCTTMLSMALELAQEDPAYEDIASKFFEHFVAIVDAMNHLGGTGLWDEEDGFYYDELKQEGQPPRLLRVRSMVGLVPLFAAEVLEDRLLERLPGFAKRLRWFLENRADLAQNTSYMAVCQRTGLGGRRLLAIPSRERLERVLRRVLDPREFLSEHGIRSLSRMHAEAPFVFHAGSEEHRVAYVPGDSDSGMFGGNSNWRGPVWFPLNYLLIEALERYHHFHGEDFQVECPTGSGTWMNLAQVARELSSRLSRLFLPDDSGRRPFHGEDARYVDDPAFRELVLFHEYFHGDTGRGLGASHQTGWTALVVQCLARHKGA